MKKFNLTVIAAITALFALGIILFQADTAIANNNEASPSATPKKRVTSGNKIANTKVKRPRQLGGVESVDNWDVERRHRRGKSKTQRISGKRVRKP